MGQLRPNDIDQDGDESVLSPRHSAESLLASRRGTDETKRVETDDSGNLYVRVAADDTQPPASVSALATGSVTAIAATVLTTIATYTAPATRKITKITAGGTLYGKFELFRNTVLIETRRSGPERVQDFVFMSPLLMNNGDILDIKVTHFNTGYTGDFEATVYGA